MQTTVKFYRDCEEEMWTWIGAGQGSREDRERILDAFMSDILETLQRSEGDPRQLRSVGAEPVAGVKPPLYEWHYSDLVVRFAVRFSYRTSWLNDIVPQWLRKCFRPSQCHITVMRILP